MEKGGENEVLGRKCMANQWKTRVVLVENHENYGKLVGKAISETYGQIDGKPIVSQFQTLQILRVGFDG